MRKLLISKAPQIDPIEEQKKEKTKPKKTVAVVKTQVEGEGPVFDPCINRHSKLLLK